MSLMQTVNYAMRALQSIFTTIVLALAGALIQQQRSGGSPTRVNYSIYAATFGLLTLFYLIPAAFVDRIRHPIATVILDLLNTLFMGAAGIAMAAKLGGRSCSNTRYLLHNAITNGGGYKHPGQRCHEANAMTAFEWFAAAAFLVSALLALDHMRREGATTRLNRGRPGMRSV